MTNYTALIHKEADSDYGVSFPDLPGCVTEVQQPGWGQQIYDTVTPY